MHIDTWLPGVSSLVGALIGAGAALGAQFFQNRSARNADGERERKLAIEEILVRALAIDLRVNDMAILASNVGSINGVVARVLGSIAPLDYAAMFDNLSEDVTALNRAAAQVWLFAEDKTVRLANAVVLAATDVVEAHTTSKRGWFAKLILIGLLGRFPRDEKQLAKTRRALANARRALAEHTRYNLDREHVDLFALPATAAD